MLQLGSLAVAYFPMLESSGPWSQARYPFRGKTFMACRNKKCLIPGAGRLFRHLGMQKVFLEFSGMEECENDLWMTGKMS
jgi:hypothetical protein